MAVLKYGMARGPCMNRRSLKAAEVHLAEIHQCWIHSGLKFILGNEKGWEKAAGAASSPA